MRLALQLTAASVLFAAALGCAKTVDNQALRKPIRQAMLDDDLDSACTAARSMTSLTASLSKKKKAHRALTILETTSGICAERDLWEAELEKVRRKRHVATSADVEAVADAKERELRLRTIAGKRMLKGWSHLVAHFGEPGEDCPKLRNDEDEFAYLLGLMAGANAMLYDQSGGGRLGVPTNTVGKVGKAASCLDDDKWWSVPSALTSSWWSMVPGTAPEGIEPWEALEQAAEKGESSGVRLARALQIVLATNAGREDIVRHVVQQMADEDGFEVNEDYILLDIYAKRLALHQSDLIWTEAEGHRTERFGELPGMSGADGGLSPSEDPFGGEDPFGAGDPFGADEPSSDSETETME
jgi:hypothetical protein